LIAQQPNFDRRVHALLGLPFDAVDIAGAVQTVRLAASSSKRCFFSTPNLNFLIACLHDTPFRNSVIHSDLSVADGMPLIWIARWLHIPLPERVAGSSMFEILRSEVSNEIKVFFFGGTPGVAEAACREINVASRGVRCVGYESPGFGSIEQMSSDSIIAHINASQADFLVVALGAKKGNAWIEHNLSRLTVPVVSHLGAVVNFVAGAVSRAPGWMQQVGLEWLWRIKEEPQLWKRYFYDGMALIHLLSSRVLPYMWYLRQHRPLPDELDRATVLADMNAGVADLKLQGAWTSSNLEPLRSAFKQVVKEDVNISLDMTEVSYVDSAFIGLLMLLHGYQQQVDKSLNVESVSNAVRRIFKWSCAEFLLGDTDEC
jgi:N-acetylglucosaminyldiphosphoundecaprenol N-acetyl-beta-D-mannosaminyltransferase